jgi:hypothetical protein
MGVSAETASLTFCGVSEVNTGRGNSIPYYLIEHYSWAYVHPMAVELFECQWLINLLLWGNYARLRDAALSELGP